MKNPLIGKTITKMMIAKDKQAILFITDEELIVRTDGDCCSETWVENIELPGFPAKVLAVENLDMPDLGSPNDYDVIEYYGCKITTDKGDIVIDYRNSSNGYYGGNLCWPGDDFYGGVFNQNLSRNEWVDINT
jgi:hypothetical protein